MVFSRTKRSLFACVAVILSLLAAEGVVRLAYRFLAGDAARAEFARYATSGARGMVHNFRAHATCLYTFDPAGPGVHESGFLGPFPPGPKKEGVFRIVVLGDSTSAGEHAWPARLRSILEKNAKGPVEMVNLAVPGYTSREGLAALRFLGSKLRPDLVIAGFGFNDLRAGMFAGFKADYSHFRKPFAPPSVAFFRRLDRFLTRHSRLWAYGRRARGAPPLVGYRLDDFILLPDARPREPADFGAEFQTAFRATLLDISSFARGLGSRIRLITTPWCEEKCRPEARKTIRRGLSVTNGIIRKLKESAIDLDGRLTGQCGLFVDQVHATPNGEEARARIVWEALAGEG